MDDAQFRSEGAFPEERDPSPPRPLEGPPRPSVPPLTAEPDNEPLSAIPNLTARRRGRKLVKPDDGHPRELTPEQRLLILDTWKRSELPGTEFASLVGLSKHTLYAWQKRFEQAGPEGLLDKPRGAPEGSKVQEVTRRTILMLKQANPDYGVQRISDLLLRGPGLQASPSTVARVLHEAGYEFDERVTHPHPDKIRFFERAKPNQLWQTDLFTFMLRRQNRRLHLVTFMDDHSRFVVGFGLHATASAALVIEVFRAAIANQRPPEEVLTDNGPQYVTWRGKSAFSKECDARGVKHIVARPRHPQTLGKAERFWGSLWRECLETAIFADLDDARRRIGLYIDHFNFQRPHQGIGGLVPADRYFGSAPEVLKTLKARVADNAADLARHGVPKKPFYVTGQLGGQPFSLHAEGEKIVLTREGAERQEVDITPPAAADALPPAVCPTIEKGDTL